jgi:hypothetical protein
MRRALTITMCGFGLALPATGAAAAGGPVPAVQGGAGTTAPGSEASFIAVGAGNGRTTVQRVIRGSGVVERYRTIKGNFGVPGVAFDGSTTGLSADGRTLVLAGITRAYPPRDTPLVVLDAVRFRELGRVTLPGTSVVDAISPDGHWLYLTHYKSVNNLNYEVLAYDLQQRRLIDKPIVDPREPDEKMQGQPVTRLMSGDGRWAYTFYARGDEAPFIHALDTVNRTAACIDVPLTDLQQVFEMKLRFGPGGALQVTHNGEALANVNTRTFAVSKPGAQQPAPAPAPKPAAHSSGGGSQFPWALMAIPAAAALAGLGVLARRRRRFRSAPA